MEHPSVHTLSKYKNPSFYFVYINATEYDTGTWESGVSIINSIDGLGLGINNLVIEITDENGNDVFYYVKIFVVDTTAPSINSPADITYVVGSTDNTIDWVAEDLNPSHYMVFLDGRKYATGQWISEMNLAINIDGLENGLYTFRIYVYDSSGNSNSDEVIVTVIGGVGRSPGFLLFISTIGILALVSLYRRRSKLANN
ncbi:MAG: hypothetical protein ACTSP3_02320 [Candidatus Heimdallarchaeaceae archaeon]